MTHPTRRGDRGAVTAELALTLPLLLAVTTGLVWLLAVGAAQVRTVDAAREVARAVARGDSESEAVARGARVAPDGASVTVSRSGDHVEVVVEAEVSGPGGVLEVLPGVTVRAEAVAAGEESP
jgi:Flp pilus assembly protein TadG